MQGWPLRLPNAVLELVCDSRDEERIAAARSWRDTAHGYPRIEALDRLVGDPPAGDVVKLTGVDDEWQLPATGTCVFSGGALVPYAA